MNSLETTTFREILTQMLKPENEEIYLVYTKRVLADLYLNSAVVYDFKDDVVDFMEAKTFDDLGRVLEPYFEQGIHAHCQVVAALMKVLFDFNPEH